MKKLDFLSNTLNKYSIRKFTVGTASILLGSLLIAGPAEAAPGDTAQAAEPTYTVGDKTWYDFNKNNLFDPAEDKGIGNITVRVYEYSGALVGETVTDANGNWSISGLKNGKYKVSFIAPDLTYQAVRQNEHMGTGQNSVGPTDALFEINGANNFDLDQGYIVPGYNKDDSSKITPPAPEPTPEPKPEPTPEPKPEPTPVDNGKYSIGDRVWEDVKDANGVANNIQDAGEKGIQGIKVTLHDYSGNFVAETVTDANGHYQFDGLANGTYRVDFETPLGWSPAIANLGTEDVDSDGPVSTLVEVNGANNFNVDQGYVSTGAVAPTPEGPTTPTPQPTDNGKYSLGDKVWWDANGNNLQDVLEKPVVGLKVTLHDYAGNFVGETVTDANGHYQFDNLSNGTYVVNFQNPLDWQPVIANIDNDVSEAIDSDGPVNVIAKIDGKNNFDVDQGYVSKDGTVLPTPTPTPEPKPADPVKPDPKPADPVKPDPVKPQDPKPQVCSIVTVGEGTPGNLEIGDQVWWDANRNNLYDNGENPVVGLRVSLRDYAGNFVAETTTNAYGKYVFKGLKDGTYIVNFHNPLDWSPVIANIDNDVSEAIDSDGPTDVIVNLQGKSNANVDQGYYGVGEKGPECPTPGGNNPGSNEPGGNNPGTTDPGTKDPGGNEPGTKDPGTNNPGTTTPGTDNPGGDTIKTTETPVKTFQKQDAKKSDSQLPDTGEAASAGLIAGTVLLAGGALLAAARRKEKAE